MGTPLTMPATAKLLTAEEFADLAPEDDHKYELVEGRVIRMSPTRTWHGLIALRIGGELDRFVRQHALGVAFTETGYTLARNPDTVRGPDVSFIRADRLPKGGLPNAFWEGPPDLVVEVLSPDDRPGYVSAKIQQYLGVGVRMVWVIQPKTRSLTIYRSAEPPITVSGDQRVEGGDVLPGFSLRISELFEGLRA